MVSSSGSGEEKKIQCPSLMIEIIVILFFIVHKIVGWSDETNLYFRVSDKIKVQNLHFEVKKIKLERSLEAKLPTSK